MGGKVYFSAADGNSGSANGEELWVSDGTETGTYVVKDINTGTGSSYPTYFAALGSMVLFSANSDGLSSGELYVTDGTETGTTMLLSKGGVSVADPESLVTVGGKVYFQADVAGDGAEPWVSDGTSTGTYMIANINTSGDSWPAGFTEMGGKVYFIATDTTYSAELRVTDGTEGNAALVYDINTSGGMGGAVSLDCVQQQPLFTG